MAQFQEKATLPGLEMAQLQEKARLPGSEMVQLQEKARLPGPGMAQLVEAAGTLRLLVWVKVRGMVWGLALVPAPTVEPQASVCLSRPAASQTAVLLQQAVLRAAGLLVLALSGLPLVWACWGRRMGLQECRCKLFRRI